MTRLSVNINKVALIRNARGTNLPNLKQFAIDCESFGAQGITVHPRPDERHIRYDDLPILKEIVTTEYNIEGYPGPRFMDMLEEVRPDQATLVPDPPGVLTSSSGWDTKKEKDKLKHICDKIRSWGIRVSLFLDPNPEMVKACEQICNDRIELYTGDFAHEFEQNPEQAVSKHVECAQTAAKMGIGLNAGHDLNLKNLYYYQSQVPDLLEVSIGHALICDSLYFGLQNTIQMYLHELSRSSVSQI